MSDRVDGDWVKAEFAARQRRHWLSIGVAGGVLGLLVFVEIILVSGFGRSVDLVDEMVFVPVFLGVFLYSLWNWRCPACSSQFWRQFNPPHCKSCGIRLRD